MPTKVRNLAQNHMNFWFALNCRNKCTAKQASKMLCIFYSQRKERHKLLQFLNDQDAVWKRSDLTNSEKMSKVFTSGTTTIDLKLYIKQTNFFENTDFVFNLHKSLVLWADISVADLVKRNMHTEWIVELEEKYQENVGDGFDIQDCVLSTCLIWIPGVTLFYLPFA